MTVYSRTLADRLSRATSVRGTEVGAFDPRRRSDTRDLLRATATDELKTLIQALAIDEDSLLEGISLMTPGDVQLNFLAGHALVASIVLIGPEFLRWAGLPCRCAASQCGCRRSMARDTRLWRLWWCRPEPAPDVGRVHSSANGRSGRRCAPPANLQC